jgi:hypothetical protein
VGDYHIGSVREPLFLPLSEPCTEEWAYSKTSSWSRSKEFRLDGSALLY